MAASIRTVWEVRATGAADNGGGFDAAYGGTDYSQSDSPILTRTDGSTNTGNTTLSSVTGGFTAAMKGNVVGITEGGTFRGFWQIVAFTNGNTVTLDRNGPVTAADCTVKVGGAQKWFQSGITPLGVNGTAVVQGGQKFWVKAGAYTISTNGLDTSLVSTGTDNPITIEGYTTTRGDGAPTRPVFTKGSGSINVLTVGSTGWIIKNCEFVTTSVDTCVVISGNANHFENCKVTSGAAGDALTVSGAGNRVRRNDLRTSTSGGQTAVNLTGAGNEFAYNLAYAAVTNTGNALLVSGTAYVHHNLLVGGVSNCVNLTGGSVVLAHNVIWGNVRGIYLFTDLVRLELTDNIIGNNSLYDIDNTGSGADTNTGGVEWQNVAMHCNAFYTLGTRVNFLPGTDDHTALSADPFTSSAGLDFSLNNTAGGGAAVRAALCTTTFATGVPTGNVAYAYPGPTGVPQTPTDTTTTIASVRSLWRELTGEKDTTVIPDATVDVYLQAGLEALNRRVGYHLTTDTTTIALVDGTEEYALPADCIEVVFVEHNGQLLDKTDVQEWRRQSINWRQGKASKSDEWAMYANKLVLYPKPNAAMVAEAATCTLRYISTPPAIGTYGAEQLGTQDYRVAVFYGVAEWSRAYPDSAFASKRADDFQAKFEAEAAVIGRNYQDRGVRP